MYVVDIKLRNTEIECDTENRMNNLFDAILDGLRRAGVPDGNIILAKENHQVCNLGHTHNTTIEQFGE